MTEQQQVVTDLEKEVDEHYNEIAKRLNKDEKEFREQVKKNQLAKYLKRLRHSVKKKYGREPTKTEKLSIELQLLRKIDTTNRDSEQIYGTEYVGVFFGMTNSKNQNDYQLNVGRRVAEKYPQRSKYAWKMDVKWVEKAGEKGKEIYLPTKADGNRKLLKYKVKNGKIVTDRNGNPVPQRNAKNKPIGVKWVEKKKVDGELKTIVRDTRQYFENDEDGKRVLTVNDNFQQPIEPQYRCGYYAIARKVDEPESAPEIYYIQSLKKQNRDDIPVPPFGKVVRFYLNDRTVEEDEYGYYHTYDSSKKFVSPSEGLYVVEEDDDVVTSIIGNEDPEDYVLSKLKKTREVPFSIKSFEEVEKRISNLPDDDYASKRTAPLSVSDVWIQKHTPPNEKMSSHMFRVQSTDVREGIDITGWLNGNYTFDKVMQGINATIIYHPNTRWSSYKGEMEWQINIMMVLPKDKNGLIDTPSLDDLEDLDDLDLDNFEDEENFVDPDEDVSVDELEDFEEPVLEEEEVTDGDGESSSDSEAEDEIDVNVSDLEEDLDDEFTDWDDQ